MPTQAPPPAPPTRARDLPLGALCRTGLLLSAAVWLPLGLLSGIARAAGFGTMVWLDRDVGPWLAIPAGLAGGLALTLANDALLAIGALLFATARRIARRRAA